MGLLGLMNQVTPGDGGQAYLTFTSARGYTDTVLEFKGKALKTDYITGAVLEGEWLLVSGDPALLAH